MGEKKSNEEFRPQKDRHARGVQKKGCDDVRKNQKKLLCKAYDGGKGDVWAYEWDHSEEKHKRKGKTREQGELI